MGKTVMVVDDSKASRRMVSFVLSIAGYEVIEAIDGLDALTKLGDAKIHMIVTDLTMPNLDGIGLIKEVRSNGVHRFVPVITLTADIQPRKKEEARNAGTTAWLSKPFNKEEFLAVVAKVLGS